MWAGNLSQVLAVGKQHQQHSTRAVGGCSIPCVASFRLHPRRHATPRATVHIKHLLLGHSQEGILDGLSKGVSIGVLIVCQPTSHLQPQLLKHVPIWGVERPLPIGVLPDIVVQEPVRCPIDTSKEYLLFIQYRNSTQCCNLWCLFCATFQPQGYKISFH